METAATVKGAIVKLVDAAKVARLGVDVVEKQVGSIRSKVSVIEPLPQRLVTLKVILLPIEGTPLPTIVKVVGFPGSSKYAEYPAARFLRVLESTVHSI